MKRLIHVRPETLARLERLAEAVSDLADYRVEALQVAALLIERDLDVCSDGDLVQAAAGGQPTIGLTGKGMKSTSLAVTDPDLAGALPALKRAAKAAWRLSVETGTPFYVAHNGRVIDRNAAHAKRGAKPNRRARAGGQAAAIAEGATGLDRKRQ